jgi:signal peptidase II
MPEHTQPDRSVIRRFLPFVLTAAIVIADQISKAMVMRYIQPYRLTRDSVSVIGEFVTFIRTQNVGVAFSIGQTWPPIARRILFIAIPLVVVVVAGLYLVRGKDLTGLQRWALGGIIGGGIGNLIDRIGRADGVVDFILVKMYGFLGQSYFPVFNVADSTVTVCGILLVVTLLFQRPANPISEVGSDTTDTEGEESQTPE